MKFLDLENDIPKHKKKKNSSTSKSVTKSKHKHEYVDCLIIDKEFNKPYKSTYCKICGKIGDFSLCMTKDDILYGCYRMMTNSEIFEKYKHLEKFYADDIWQKYVPISKGGE